MPSRTSRGVLKHNRVGELFAVSAVKDFRAIEHVQVVRAYAPNVTEARVQEHV